MSEHHGNLVVRFYPAKGEWTCVVQRVDADGMPMGEDLVTATGKTKDDARARAATMTEESDIRAALLAAGGL
jgi:hypothetical protein